MMDGRGWGRRCAGLPVDLTMVSRVEKPSKNSNAVNHHMVGSSNMRIEILRELPKGSMVVLQRKEFEALFRDSDPRRRADNIARLNGCDLTLDEKSGVARFTRVE